MCYYCCELFLGVCVSHYYKLFFARCLLCGCGMVVGVFDLAVAAVVASVVHWCHLITSVN